MTIGLALIAKNEARTLPTLLASIEGAFDRVVLLDTGSTDRTVALFEEWAKGQDGLSWQTGHYQWTHDFADARNTADQLLGHVDWRVWADCDDEIVGAQHLRQLAAAAPPDVVALVGLYDYAHDEHGQVVCELKRERVVRAGHGGWIGRVHEAQVIDGPTMEIDPSVCRWVHRKQPTAPDSNTRNLRILRAWLRDEPNNPRVLAYLGTEEQARGRHKRAVTYLRRYLKLVTGWPEERAQVHRKLAVSLMALDRDGEAIDVALEAQKVVPGWPDSHLTLAEAHYKLGEHDKAIFWAREVLRIGKPETLLILNPTDYTFRPLLVLAGALGALGRVDEAIDAGQQALAIQPDHGELRAHMASWKAESKRETVARTVIGQAHLLVAHDEQLKALRLLEDCCPHFVQDHPAVVAERSRLRERILWARDPALHARHYGAGGVKPEDPHTDDEAVEVASRLPRAHFLARTLDELKEAA